MAEIIVALTIIGNIILCLIMLYQGWVPRLRWFWGMSALAVLIDCLCYFIHGFDHKLYAPLRVFILYWLFPILEGICAWEAFRARVVWLEQLMLIQVGMGAIALFAHLHGDLRTVYRVEMFICYFNLIGIAYSIYRLRGEYCYEPRA